MQDSHYMASLSDLSIKDIFFMLLLTRIGLGYNCFPWEKIQYSVSPEKEWWEEEEGWRRRKDGEGEMSQKRGKGVNCNRRKEKCLGFDRKKRWRKYKVTAETGNVSKLYKRAMGNLKVCFWRFPVRCFHWISDNRVNLGKKIKMSK